MPLTIGTALSDEDLSKTSLIGAIERVLGVPIKLMLPLRRKSLYRKLGRLHLESMSVSR